MSSGKDRLFEIINTIRKYDLIKNMSAERLRLAIEELGPTFIKLGQILSYRDDVIPKEYCEELSHLRNQVKPMKFEKVMEILDGEYKGQTKDVFQEIDEMPIGSASIAQVHRAKLMDGTDVVIKIQREHIYERMETDVNLIKKVIKTFRIQKIFNSVFDFDSIIDEMFASAKEEMNFLIEAEHTERFHEYNKDVVYIRSPKVYNDYTTSKVLVMEYMDGVLIDNFEKLKELGYNMDEIGEKLGANYIKQAIDDGYFHADPHTDNLKINDGKIVYMDFGMMGVLSKRDRTLLSKCILAIVRDDIDEVEHILLTLGTARGQVDHMGLKSDIKTVLDKNKNQDVLDIDVKNFTNDLLSMLSKNNVTMPKDITMLIRGIIVMEGVLRKISPRINLISLLETHVKPSEVLSKEDIGKFTRKGIESGTSLVYIPNELLTFLKGVNSGELRFNIELNDSKHQIRNIEQLVHLVMITILDVAYILGTSLIVMQNHDDLPFIFYIYLIMGGICTIWIFYKLFMSKLKNRRG